MDKIYEQTMLYDFYGELLTDHQRSIYEDAVYNDMSLGEIAEERGISRQGVHDLIRRCDRILQDYESKLHLVERFARAKETVMKIKRLACISDTAGLEQTEGHIRTEGPISTEGHIRSEDPADADRIIGIGDNVDLAERLQRIGSLAQGLMEEL